MGIGGFYFLLEPILVSEIMTSHPITVAPDVSAHHAAWIMVERRFGALPVVENGKTVGIITETDLLRCFTEQAVEPDRVAKSSLKKARSAAKSRRER
jgi:signal-transduction protein with cAMP-binding, CBS, and nucleotidyltransferase domain